MDELRNKAVRAAVETEKARKWAARDTYYETVEVHTIDVSQDTAVDVRQSGYVDDGVLLRPARVVAIRRKS
jgi:hypothetical protein